MRARSPEIGLSRQQPARSVKFHGPAGGLRRAVCRSVQAETHRAAWRRSAARFSVVGSGGRPDYSVIDYANPLRRGGVPGCDRRYTPSSQPVRPVWRIERVNPRPKDRSIQQTGCAPLLDSVCSPGTSCLLLVMKRTYYAPAGPIDRLY